MKPIRHLVLREGALSLMRSGALFMLDTIAPPDPEVRRIERMATEDFIAEAGEPAEAGPPDTVSFFPYRTPLLKTALVELKNHGSRDLARAIGAAFASKLRELPTRDHARIFLPVPITAKKKRERGFNQCELIGDALLDAGFDVRNNVLVKNRETADQVGKRRGERFDNLVDSFAVSSARRHEVVGKDVAVFDDIVTTGATLYEARKTLLAAGARSVLCVAIAR